jgi:mannose-1-phosphate guanylyltransferase / phosphomannomutase
VLALVPPYFISSAEAPCPWDAKGRVMRGLHERASQENASGMSDQDGAGQIEGVRFGRDGEWAVVLPDPDKPVFHVYTESGSLEAAQSLAGRYVDLVKRLEAEASRPLAAL